MAVAVTSNKAAWDAIKTFLQSMGSVTAVLGQPRDTGVQSGMVAIIAIDGHIDETTLSSPREIHHVMLRRFEAAAQQPSDDVDERLDQWRANIMRDIFGDFDLGGDIAYALPVETNWAWSYQTYNNIEYRVLDININYRVDDRAVFS